MNKRLLVCLLLAALILTACSTSNPKPSLPSTDNPSPTESDTSKAFGKILWNAYQQGVLPDGTTLDYTGTEAAAQNDFAVFDVDNDGKEELLLYWTNACMAGMRTDVFGYNNNEVHHELTVFPSSVFYSNGAVTEDWSHNQGAAGEGFWPYSIHLYDAEKDIYTLAGAADAWDRNLIAEGFPSDIDSDGDGMVYFLLPRGEAWSYTGNRPDYPPVDGEEYEVWRNRFLSGAQKLEIHTQKLTEQNISALGCPKPEISHPEPLG